MNTYRLIKMNTRGVRYYAVEIATRRRHSLETVDREEAEKLLHALNERHRNAHLNQMIGRIYLSASDPQSLTRTWQTVLDSIIASKPVGSDARRRWVAFSQDKAIKRMLQVPLLETTHDLLLAVLKEGPVSTYGYLRQLRKLARDLGWLP